MFYLNGFKFLPHFSCDTVWFQISNLQPEQKGWHLMYLIQRMTPSVPNVVYELTRHCTRQCRAMNIDN